MPYPITTDRLSLSPLSQRDVAEFVAYRQDAEVARWQGWNPSYSETDAAALIAAQPSTDIPEAGRWLQLAIRDLLTDAMHGDVAIHAIDGLDNTFEIGITLTPASQRHGIAAEAVKRIFELLFAEAHAHRIIATCDTRNEPVARLLVGVGMRRESSQLDVEFFKGEWITLDGYALLRREYTASAAVS